MFWTVLTVLKYVGRDFMTEYKAKGADGFIAWK